MEIETKSKYRSGVVGKGKGGFRGPKRGGRPSAKSQAAYNKARQRGDEKKSRRNGYPK